MATYTDSTTYNPALTFADFVAFAGEYFSC